METEVKEKKLKGVGGWLLFFIITLTILNPIVQIVSVVKVFTNIADVPVELYNLRNIIIMDSIIGSVVIDRVKNTYITNNKELNV